MDPPPLQSSEIDSSSSPIPSSVTSVPDDDNQTLTNSPKNSEQQQNPPTQNPSSPPADSDTVQIPLPQAPDPPNSEPENVDHDLQQPEQEDPDDQEGMMLSPSHPPLISDANVDEERGIFPPSSSSRRFQSRRGGKRGIGKRKLAALERKFQALAKNMKSVPFVPSKALDFSRHEDNLRGLGLWDFAHLEFDRKVRNDLVAKLIVNYNEKNRSSYVDDVRILVNQSDLARALNLPCKKPVDCWEEDWSGDFISFLDDFVSSWMLLHEDTWMLPSEVMTWTGMIKEGHPEKVDWAKLIWFMVKRELSKGAQLENCYYASHLQHLLKCQKESLFKEKSPDEVEEIMVLKDDEEDEGDVKMAECEEVSHGGESEMNLENAPPSVDEGIVNVQSDMKMEENVDSLGHSDGTTDCAVSVENEKSSGGQVENPKITTDRVESLKIAVDHVENLKSAVDHVENLETAAVDPVENLETAAVDHVENLETAAVDPVENLETAAVDHVENLETAAVDPVDNLETAAVDHVENLKPAVVDHVEYLKPASADDVENLESTGDHVENPKPAAVDLDHEEYLEISGDHVENLESTGDVEDMNIDGDHVEEDNKVTLNVMEDTQTNAEIQETGCNDLIDFEVCKVDDQNPWVDLSRKDDDQDHFLQQCTLSEAKVNEDQPAEELDDDEPEDEDDGPAQGFEALQKCNSFMQPYAAPDFDNHVMLGGPSFSSKRELDLDVPSHSLNDSHKRMRTENPSDLDFCFDQMQQWMEKSRMAYMSSQQTTMNQQQLLFNELGSKDHLIQELKMSNNELQRRRQAEIARYENELYAMSSIIDGYRKALKSTQHAFAEYRKSVSLPDEPLYRDAGEGGVVKSVAELEKERLKQEEKERLARIMVENFEKEWEGKFEGHLEEVVKCQARVSDIEKGVGLLRESIGKRKASETVS